MPRTLVVGSRASHLARAMVAELVEPLRAAHPGLVVKHKTVMTTGDLDRKSSLSSLGAETAGAFATQLEAALLAGEIDLAVHSLKDLATAMPDGLALSAVPVRANPLDALCGSSLANLPVGAKVGTGSARRVGQLLALRPDVVMVPIRGNVPPRLRRAKDGGLDAVILAAAGLERLGLGDEITELLSLDVFPPSPGQGALGVQIREGDTDLHDLLAVLHDPATAAAVHAERSLLAVLHGGCSVPVGAYGHVRDGRLHLAAQVTAVDGTRVVRAAGSCPLAAASGLGEQVAAQLIDGGAEDILSAVRAAPTPTHT